MTDRPLILITNDDGIQSPGLRAAAQAVADLGDLLIMAPSTQQTGAGRSYPTNIDDTIHSTYITLNGQQHRAYSAKVSPAQAVRLALTDLAERPIDLCISGINYGENIGSGVTISGTVGAAIEAGCSEIPALAVSLETPQEYHRNHSDAIDFSIAAHFTRLFVQKVLKNGLPPHVDLLKIDVPASATLQTGWRMGRVSRNRYYQAVPKQQRQAGEVTYQINFNLDQVEPDSDVYILAVEKQVAVVPMTIDLTAPVTLSEVSQFLTTKENSTS
jgi:5'-nucleotidase